MNKHMKLLCKIYVVLVIEICCVQLVSTFIFNPPFFSKTPRSVVWERNEKWKQDVFQQYSHDPFILKTEGRNNTISSELGVTKVTQKIVCHHCGKEFQTRNSLFRHLRNDPSCSNNLYGPDTNLSAATNTKRDTVAILFSYDSFLPEEKEDCTDFDSRPSDAEIINQFFCDAFHYALQQQFANSSNDDDDNTDGAKTSNIAASVISCTQSSVAKLRGYKSLSLENGVSATGDVITLSYKYPVRRTLLDEKKSYQELQRTELFLSLKQHAINYLSTKSPSSSSLTSHITDVKILSAKILSSDTMFHAERSCTQRVYHYLLPIKWIEGGSNIEKWWLENHKNNNDNQVRINHKIKSNTKSGIKGEMSLGVPTPKELRLLKNVLRSFESQNVDELDSTNDDLNVNKKRFGRLATKKLRPWHNFADPAIRGAAVSPNNKPVWRALDRCRIVKLLSFDDDQKTITSLNHGQHTVAVIEFRGDDFIQQQVRRIVGTTIAIANGWLPINFSEISTLPEVFIETPLAPPNHMYQTRPRFHFDELSNNGKSIFSDEVDDDFEVQLTKEVHDNVIARFLDQTESENTWLQNLQQIVAPRICEKLKNQEEEYFSDGQNIESIVPHQYKKSLTLLQQISSSGRWPATSIARSKVIKDEDYDSNEKGFDIKQNGSFTIINPKYLDGILMKDESQIKIPLGNELFPELVDAIFELEGILSKEIQCNKLEIRPASSHCAVNRNAQFTPHVDSGRGCGQSLSMIVGLGSYKGGNLFIEDESVDICYQPKEFDGWRDRHWTEAFEGERFSLVWFTPEMKGVNDTK